MRNGLYINTYLFNDDGKCFFLLLAVWWWSHRFGTTGHRGRLPLWWQRRDTARRIRVQLAGRPRDGSGCQPEVSCNSIALSCKQTPAAVNHYHWYKSYCLTVKRVKITHSPWFNSCGGIMLQGVEVCCWMILMKYADVCSLNLNSTRNVCVRFQCMEWASERRFKYVVVKFLYELKSGRFVDCQIVPRRLNSTLPAEQGQVKRSGSSGSTMTMTMCGVKPSAERCGAVATFKDGGWQFRMEHSNHRCAVCCMESAMR